MVLPPLLVFFMFGQDAHVSLVQESLGTLDCDLFRMDLRGRFSGHGDRFKPIPGYPLFHAHDLITSSLKDYY